FDSLLHALGFAEPISLLYTPTAVVIGLVYWYLPFMVYPIYGSIEKFDFTLIEAAHDLGATRFQAFRKVLLPLTMPGVMAGSLLVFISALGTFVVPALLGGDKTLMWGNLIQQRFLSTPQDWPLGAALSLAMMLFMSVGIWFYFRVNRESA
ncbi:ABC transporter permease, partial [Candidatus Acetothermia bacterium]|nr:ABC transporter permease [Candidatus Acetothermia bacterium]